MAGMQLDRDEHSRALKRIAVLEAALERIAACSRPDGTYNLSREACEQVARGALHNGTGDGAWS